jgi:large subunit ribosomal protein L1
MKVDIRKPAKTKNLRAARSKIDHHKHYDLPSAITAIKDSAFVKFDPSLEIVMKLGVDPRHSDQMVRGITSLPAGTGKTVRVAVICKEEKESEAKAAGADLVGGTDLIDEIKAGKINFDVCITTPDMMVAIGQVARVLGPKGLMPNPKLGTVTQDITTAVKNAKGGQVEFRVEKAGIIHVGVGKLSFSADDLSSNVKTLVSAVLKAKPSGAKGAYVKGLYLSSTMGPSVKLDLASVA